MLPEILQHKRRELAEIDSAKEIAHFNEVIASLPAVRSLKAAITNNFGLALIAEIKRRSPSRGALADVIDPAHRARLYQQAGAAAVSVLTDQRFFNGSIIDLQLARAAVSLPVLRKDFILTEYQVFESRAIGADAILLIVAALRPDELADLHHLAHRLGLEVLMEVHDEAELHIALEAGATILGVNNRNLDTFEVDLATTERLRRLIPADRVCVAESGIHTSEDTRRLRAIDVDAILVGESLMTADDVAAQVRTLMEVSA
ncbi:indole-3-glycerol phosphate synthase TrpC [candidate division GN15 bacterium]|nr:indole-3-glycerol phosphate synthase TrpC [candidate division GN15 bacterium]